VRVWLLAASVAAFLVALSIAPHDRSRGFPLRDFEAYYAAGETWTVHGDPYSRDVWRGERTIAGVDASRDEVLPFVGPPFGLPLWSTLANLSFRGASFVWAIVLGLAFATIALGALAHATGRLTLRASIATLLFAAAFAPMTGGLALGQVALLACAAIVAMPWLLQPGRTLGAVLATLAAGLQPNLAIVLAVRATDRRARIAYVAAALIALLGSALALGGLAEIARYVSILREHGAAERFIAIQTTVGAVLWSFGASPALAGACALAIGALVVAFVVFGCARGAYAPNDRLWVASAALPLAVPFAHQHDYAIVFAPALALVVRTSGALWAASACAALALGVDWLGLAQRPPELATALAFAFAGACALVALAPGPLRAPHAAPFAVVALVALAWTFARAHPLPTWPDALPPHFHVAAKLPSAVVWGAEQASSGIANRDPVWGALRAIDLVATLVIAVAAALHARARARLGAWSEPTN